MDITYTKGTTPISLMPHCTKCCHWWKFKMIYAFKERGAWFITVSVHGCIMGTKEILFMDICVSILSQRFEYVPAHCAQCVNEPVKWLLFVYSCYLFDYNSSNSNIIIAIYLCNDCLIYNKLWKYIQQYSQSGYLPVSITTYHLFLLMLPQLLTLQRELSNGFVSTPQLCSEHLHFLNQLLHLKAYTHSSIPLVAA